MITDKYDEFSCELLRLVESARSLRPEHGNFANWHRQKIAEDIERIAKRLRQLIESPEFWVR